MLSKEKLVASTSQTKTRFLKLCDSFPTSFCVSMAHQTNAMMHRRKDDLEPSSLNDTLTRAPLRPNQSSIGHNLNSPLLAPSCVIMPQNEPWMVGFLSGLLVWMKKTTRSGRGLPPCNTVTPKEGKFVELLAMAMLREGELSVIAKDVRVAAWARISERHRGDGFFKT